MAISNPRSIEIKHQKYSPGSNNIWRHVVFLLGSETRGEPTRPPIPELFHLKNMQKLAIYNMYTFKNVRGGDPPYYLSNTSKWTFSIV